MQIVEFISTETLRKVYGFDLNTDQIYITPNCIKGQRFIIKPILGDEKYDEITEYIILRDASGVTTQSMETLLDEYIGPILAYYIKSEIVFNTAYKMKNNPAEPNGERFNELVRISKKYLDDSNAFVQLLKDYMCDNSIVQGDEYERRSKIYFGSNSKFISVNDNYKKYKY